MFHDPKALELESRIPPEKLDPHQQTEYTFMASAVRSLNIDISVKKFLTDHPDGVIVELGCGLETTFYRCHNGQTVFYELDLPEVIEARRTLLPPSDRHIFLPYSMFDDQWIQSVKDNLNGRAILFVAAGLFYYFEKDRDLELL